MSKTFEKQVEILQKNLDITYDEVKEKMIVYNATDENEEGKLIISSDFLKVFEYMKFKEKYNKLLAINVVKQNQKFEIEYSLYSTVKDEYINLYIKVENRNQSISCLYDNASILEEQIDDMFDIIFY